ncbi:MAG: ParB/RepB/Spo0J family partition protein [Planctomycetes bacterium]|nr:ParB/RepB/Spo0J family partition protein [Planctomycetota bacterium]
MSKQQPSRLGKGLSALIGPRIPNTPFRQIPAGPAVSDVVQPAGGAAAANPSAAILSIPTSQIKPNPRQPRSTFDDASINELAASIRISGVLQPLLVRRVADHYELVAGERRLRAAQIAGLSVVPAIVRSLSDAESLEIALIENLQREDLGPLDRAAAYQQYIETFRSSAEQLSTRLGESRTNVINYLRLLRLPAEIQEMVRGGQLSMGQARALLAAATPEQQMALAKLAVRRNLPVRQIEELAKADPAERRAAAPAKPLDRHTQNLETTLSKSLGLPVTLKPGKSKNSGTLLIRYNTLEEFDRVAERITGRTALE